MRWSQRVIRAAQKEKVGAIPVPPKYGSGDFKTSVWWSLRGKLDVLDAECHTLGITRADLESVRMGA